MLWSVSSQSCNQKALHRWLDREELHGTFTIVVSSKNDENIPVPTVQRFWCTWQCSGGTTPKSLQFFTVLQRFWGQQAHLTSPTSVRVQKMRLIPAKISS